MAVTLQPKTRVEYKKPSALNGVSLALLLLAGVLVYVGHSLWPVFAIRSGAKSEMLDMMPDLWRANLRPDAVSRGELTRIKKELMIRIQRAGVKDPKLEVTLHRNKQRVAIESRFKLVATFPWLDKQVTFACAPRVETDAARVEW